MIESIYLLLSSLYCSQLRDFLSGYSCQTEAFSGANLYNEIGLVTFALILLILTLYYKVFDPSEGKLFKWGIALGVTSLLSAFGAYFWAYRAESKGFIGQCLLKDDNGNNLIGFMDYVGLGISNAIIAAVFFFILSFAIRYISVNNRYIPFLNMKEVYVLAIGGSGARILRSLVMLLAAGVETGAKIIPIIIDPDEGAGNLSETIQLLELYQRIREKATDGQVDALITFSTPIEKVSGADYLVKLNNVAGEKFREYVGESLGMSESSRSLLSSLFSRGNLELDMTIGFKGNPNIGSIVLGQFEENKTYEDFLKDLQNGDSSQKSIFIISSIFGGTGASGFPTLLKSLRSHQTVVRDMRIGALSLLPYFSLQNNEDSAIDSATFYAKTRAALSYYMANIIGNNNVDDFYLLGDKTPNSYDNHDGGKAQRNMAHFVELAGAMSIVHFARQEAARPQPVKAQMYEYGINGGNQGSSIGFKNLGDQMEKDLATPLTAFYLMRRFLENTDVSKDLDPWLKSIQPTLDGAFVDDLEEFLIQYEQWLGELGAHRSHGFVPLSLDQSIDDLFNCVPEYKVEKKSFFSKLTGSKENIALYRNTLNSLSKEHGAPTTEGGLLNMLSDASYDLCRDEIKLP